jgi:exopolyphosphatase/guanosine-5'-triphosphate,3'-diphosphate pyrophosphatase
MPRYATIDIGTNSVLLLVADRGEDGRFTPVVERAEITRLGRGVDKTRQLSPEGVEATLTVLEDFANEARKLGAEGIAVSATSAARDASNGQAFLDAARERADVTVEIIGGDKEARLTYLAAHLDFGGRTPLCVLDIGGGSTEYIYGTPDGQPTYARSLDVGSVRLTERFLHSDPPAPGELAALLQYAAEQLSQLPPPPKDCTVVGVAGTVTTLLAVLHAVEPYDAGRIHGKSLSNAELMALIQKLTALPLEERRKLPGLQPKRADVIIAGALILLASLDRLGATQCIVGDRGVRWGLMAERFGAGSAK